MSTSELARTDEEARERFLGLSTLEVARQVVAGNQHIRQVNLRAYFYVPDTPSQNEPGFVLNRSDFLYGDSVEQLCATYFSREGWNVALDSRVIAEAARVGHLPILDLGIDKSEEALLKVPGEIRRRMEEVGLNPDGFLLETGSSYHYLGSKLLTEEQWWRVFNYLALTFAVVMENNKDGTPNEKRYSTRLTDPKYIGWSGLRQTAGLRLTTNGSKTFTPKVVAVV